MPGDNIVGKPSFNATRAVTIHAPAENIYPWIVQMGVTRAGWYSYDLLDNLARPSAESILPEHQNSQVGDVIAMSPDGKQGMRVKDFRKNNWMLWWDDIGDSSWRQLATDPGMSKKMLELIRYATLAANGHNAQPWKFAIQENTVEIQPDYTRCLPVVDPNDRELWISLGCALENLLVAARAIGFAFEVVYPGTADFIHVRLIADTSQSSPLFDAIPLRQNTRTEFDGRLIKREDLDQISALQLEPGVVLRFARNPTEMETVLEYVIQGNLNQYADEAFVDELIYWLRFNKKESLASLDGLYSLCSGNPEVPRWLGQMFVAGRNPKQQADADARNLRTSPIAVVVASESDDKTAWVRTGQVYEPLALKMTSLNFKSAFLNQLIEVTELRSQFQSAMGMGESPPQLLIRFGYADLMPRSLRRPVNQVIM